MSIASGDVPRIFTPAASRPCVSLRGVCPPTPFANRGFERAATRTDLTMGNLLNVNVSNDIRSRTIHHGLPLSDLIELLHLRENPRIHMGELFDPPDPHSRLERALDLKDS